MLVQLGLAASTASYHFSPLQRQISIYSVFVSVLGLLLTGIIMGVDILRENALFSRVIIEVSWLAVLFVFEIAASAAQTAVLPQLTCSDEILCNDFGAVTGISWVITLSVVAYLLLLLTCAILHHDAYPHVWKTGVRDFPWFMNSRPGSRMPSRPGSPEKPKVPKEPFYRKHSDLSKQELNLQPKLVAPQPRYFANPILPEEHLPLTPSPISSIQPLPRAYQGSPHRLTTHASLEFLNSDVDRRGRTVTRDDSPRPLSRRPSRKRPPPLDLSKVNSI